MKLGRDVKFEIGRKYYDPYHMLEYNKNNSKNLMEKYFLITQYIKEEQRYMGVSVRFNGESYEESWSYGYLSQFYAPYDMKIADNKLNRKLYKNYEVTEDGYLLVEVGNA